MLNCPCEECISFAICYARIREEFNIPDVVQYSKRRRCKDLRAYLFRSRSSGDTKDNIPKTRLLFGLPEKKPGRY